MTTKHLILMSMLLSMIILLGYIPPIIVPILPVPIVVQNLAIMLIGGLLGWRHGAIVVLLFLLMAAIGLPVLSGGRGGIAIFFTASGGYLLGYLIATISIGYVFQLVNYQFTFIQALFIMLIFGVVLINLSGVLFITFYIGAPFIKTLLASLLFLPGDIIKAMIASLLVYRLKRIIKPLYQ